MSVDDRLSAIDVSLDALAGGVVPTGLVDGAKRVASAGTAEALTASVACKGVLVTALPGNTQRIVAGGSPIAATASYRGGAVLSANDSTTLAIDTPAKVFLDSQVAGEGASFTVIL